jgi:hypothetical protein
MRLLLLLCTLLLGGCAGGVTSKMTLSSGILPPSVILEMAEALDTVVSGGLSRTCNIGRFENKVEIDVSVTGRTVVQVDRYCEVRAGPRLTPTLPATTVPGTPATQRPLRRTRPSTEVEPEPFVGM